MATVILDTDFLSSFLKEEMAQIIRDLKEKDYYKFKHEVRETLLK